MTVKPVKNQRPPAPTCKWGSCLHFKTHKTALPSYNKLIIFVLESLLKKYATNSIPPLFTCLLSTFLFSRHSENIFSSKWRIAR